jgi:hypothetical protein
MLPTAYQEIMDLCLETGDSEIRTRALDALRFMATYPIFAAPSPYVHVGKDKELANCLVERGIVASEHWDQALLLSEAACQEVSFFVTLDSIIIDVDRDMLAKAIDDRHLSRFEILTV